MNWVWTSVIGSLTDRKNCLTFCWLEDKFNHGYEQIQQLGAEIDELIGTKDRSTKITTLVQQYNQLLDEMDKIGDQKSGHLATGTNERMLLQQKKWQTLWLRQMNRYRS